VFLAIRRAYLAREGARAGHLPLLARLNVVSDVNGTS
jgi:hypothetical protein